MSNLFGSPPPTPQVTPPAPMPDQEDAATKEARRKRLAETLARGGRGSTILTDGGAGAPNYDSYTGKSLGG